MLCSRGDGPGAAAIRLIPKGEELVVQRACRQSRYRFGWKIKVVKVRFSSNNKNSLRIGF